MSTDEDIPEEDPDETVYSRPENSIPLSSLSVPYSVHCNPTIYLDARLAIISRT